MRNSSHTPPSSGYLKVIRPIDGHCIIHVSSAHKRSMETNHRGSRSLEKESKASLERVGKEGVGSKFMPTKYHNDHVK